jgi:hypothetical protein
MSFAPTPWRRLARSGWGGRADFRGSVATDQPTAGLTETDPQVLGADHWGQIGTVYARLWLSTSNRAIVGVAKLSDGSVAAGASVDLHRTSDNSRVMSTTTDAAGNFRFDNPGPGPFYIDLYLTGSPDYAGASVNTLEAT